MEIQNCVTENMMSVRRRIWSKQYYIAHSIKTISELLLIFSFPYNHPVKKSEAPACRSLFQNGKNNGGQPNCLLQYFENEPMELDREK